MVATRSGLNTDTSLYQEIIYEHHHHDHQNKTGLNDIHSYGYHVYRNSINFTNLQEMELFRQINHYNNPIIRIK